MKSTGSRRQRWLASDKRAGQYPRELAKAKRKAFVRRLAPRLAIAALVLAVITLGAVWLINRMLAPGQLVIGLALGCGFTTLFYELRRTIREGSGSVTAELGQQGEQWTAQELRKLRGDGWRVVNHVVLRRRDIDHVLVGPGGVYAIESKWKSDPLRLSPLDSWIVEAVTQARSNARDLTMWHDLKTLGVGEVKPVVFFWGPGAVELPPVFEHQGVTVVKGSSSGEWRASLVGHELDGPAIQAVWDALDRQCRTRDA